MSTDLPERGARMPSARARFARRFLRQRIAVGALVVLLALTVTALVAPWIVPFDPNAQNLGNERAEPRREQIDSAPYERFAAGEADTADAARNKAFGKCAHFFYTEDRGSRQKLHLLGHTIPTSEVAAIGNGQAQIGDAPTVTVGEWSDRRGGICGHRLNDGAKGKRLASKAC